MYVHQGVMLSGKPREIISYDTVVYPFDMYVWVFTFSMIIAQFGLLIIMQNLWSNLSGKANPWDYIFQGFIMPE